MTQAAVTRLRRIVLVVTDLESAERFFVDAFDFSVVERLVDPALPILLGTPDVHVRQTVMRLGDQEVGLLAFDPPGRPYPTAGTSTDLWFQHFAIIVSDMEQAYGRLRATGRFVPISQGGPQVLPPRSGSVVAFKFRDTDGHPLELLVFPPGDAPAYWKGKGTDAVFLGIDHSAISVRDTASSVAFYESCFGLKLGEQTENHGAEQSLLDAVPDASVTVSGLKPSGSATPHVELLGYHNGTRHPIADDTRSQDIAASILVLETDDLAQIVEALTAAGARFVSPGVVTLSGGSRAVAVLDPDGHRLIVIQA